MLRYVRLLTCVCVSVCLSVLASASACVYMSRHIFVCFLGGGGGGGERQKRRQGGGGERGERIRKLYFTWIVI